MTPDCLIARRPCGCIAHVDHLSPGWITRRRTKRQQEAIDLMVRESEAQGLKVTREKYAEASKVMRFWCGECEDMKGNR